MKRVPTAPIDDDGVDVDPERWGIILEADTCRAKEKISHDTMKKTIDPPDHTLSMM